MVASLLIDWLSVDMVFDICASIALRLKCDTLSSTVAVGSLSGIE